MSDDDISTQSQFSFQSRVGKQARIIYKQYPIGHMVCLSSRLEDIGVVWDISIPNHLEVVILSDTTKHLSPKHGEIEVIRVFGQGRAFWAMEETVVEMDEPENLS